MSIKLREINEEDLEVIMNWRMSPEVTKYMYTDPVLTMGSQKKWFQKINENKDKEKYWIIQLENGIDVGLISVNNIDFINKTANWAYYLGDMEARGKGLAKTLECNLYDFVFEKLNLNKLWYEVLEFNDVVVKIHQKFGGKIEGKFINHICKDGKYHNVIRMATFKEDWLKLKDNITYNDIEFQ